MVFYTRLLCSEKNPCWFHSLGRVCRCMRSFSDSWAGGCSRTSHAWHQTLAAHGSSSRRPL